MSQQDSASRFVIDSLEFSRERRDLAGEVAIASLARLSDLLFDAEGAVDFSVSGEIGGEGRKFLAFAIDGALHLKCQRCLGRLDFALQLRNRLLLVAPGEAWPDETLEDDSFDAIAAERTLDLLPLVEEEVLLAMPQAPRHDVCSAPDFEHDRQADNPFAALTGLKKGSI